MADLVVTDVRFTYPDSTVETLRGGTVQLGPGKPWVLTGANGAGKSTWLKIVAGLLPRSSGTVTYDGTTLRRGQALYADPVPNLFDELSALEHMQLISEMWMMTAEEASTYIAVVTDALEQLNIDDPHSRVENYSSGMREKLALCLVLLLDAPVVFLDEPLTASDASSRDILLNLIGYRAETSVTVIVSHLQEIASVLNASELNLSNGVIHEI